MAHSHFMDQKKSFIFILVPLLIAVLSIVGYVVYVNRGVFGNYFRRTQLRQKLTPQARQCILQKLGRAKAQALVESIKQTKVIPPEDLAVIQSCISDLNTNLFPPSSSNAVYQFNQGILLGTGVIIQQEPQYCQIEQQYGSKFNWLTLSWQRVEPQKGNWTWDQFDNWVNGYENCGQEVAVHLLSDASWATEPVPADLAGGRHKPSMPAKNYQDYYDFVYHVASHYKGRVRRYSIENEAHADANWGGTPEQYMQELQTAYKAIHAADPTAIVEDAAMSHEGLGYLTTAWLYQQGKTQAAVDFANSYDAHFQRNSQSLHAHSAADIQALVNSPGIQKLITWENLLFQNHAYYDHMQIHNGTSWQDLQTVLDYLHTNLRAEGDDKPLDLWEGWYGWWGAPGNGFNPQIQAQDIVKQAVTAFGGQVTVYNYWLINDFALSSEGHVGLIDNQGRPRPAATAYKVMSGKLTGATSVKKLNLGNNIWGYEFDNANKKVYVVWSTVNTPVTLPFTGSATVTDIAGNTTSSSNIISVNSSPFFVEPGQ